MLSNRISHVFDFRGPSATVDTACSSSLVAVHLARQAILHDNCPMAIAGGVNVMLSPATMIAMCKGQFLAADGRSKAFDASADGYGRGEGAAVVLLKRLDLALADKNYVYAVIRSSGVNQDGHTDGISLPNGAAQKDLAESVLRASGIQAIDIGYVEAHGTGTRVGDPIEARALGEVYGMGRDQPLRIGSIKTNLGHLEAAAGITGLVKAVLSVSLRQIFPQVGPNSPNPEIPFEELGLRVASSAEPWPRDGAAYAAVNAFGYGGTNAHVIVGEWEMAPSAATSISSSDVGRTLLPVPVCAMSAPALAAFTQSLATCVSDLHWIDQAYTLARHREQLPERAVILASGPEELRREFANLALATESDYCVRGRATAEQKLLWVFTGMGPQWWAMGRELLSTEPAFRNAVNEADAEFRRLASWSPLEEMLRDEEESRIHSNDVAQSTNFLIQVGLAALLRAYGVPVHAALGHSAGEVAAALTAGCLPIGDAVRVVYHRSRLQQRAAGKGSM